MPPFRLSTQKSPCQSACEKCWSLLNAIMRKKSPRMPWQKVQVSAVLKPSGSVLFYFAAALAQKRSVSSRNPFIFFHTSSFLLNEYLLKNFRPLLHIVLFPTFQCISMSRKTHLIRFSPLKAYPFSFFALSQVNALKTCQFFLLVLSGWHIHLVNKAGRPHLLHSFPCSR